MAFYARREYRAIMDEREPFDAFVNAFAGDIQPFRLAPSYRSAPYDLSERHSRNESRPQTKEQQRQALKDLKQRSDAFNQRERKKVAQYEAEELE
ncbi:hypothetical protein LTR85_011366 [Meristemomyces frigidus]|nr:hypothetical protein LTR85_011366 [Meristemomyces frigidus]